LDTYASDTISWLALCTLYIHSSRFAPAVFCLEEVLLIKGVEDPLILTRIAECYYGMGDWSMAVKYFGRAVEIERTGRSVWGLWSASGRAGTVEVRGVARGMLAEMYAGSGVALELGDEE
jgi:tetratricopeptide (TPR) repeat protein